jgi:two-component system NtrC family sensor kinase
MEDLREPHRAEESAPRSPGQADVKSAERRLAARTRELDLLQALGRHAAEAKSARELFSATISVLQLGEEIDLAVVAYRQEAGPDLFAYLSRPVAGECVESLARRAGDMLGWSPDSIPAPRLIKLDTFDEARGERNRFRDRDLIVLPILRKQSAVACLLILPARAAGEEQLRLLYSATNQLCLHLDRILTVQEAEQDRFRSILDSMPQAVVLTDHELRLVQANQSASSMFERLGLPLSGSLERVVRQLRLQETVRQVSRGDSAVADREVCLDGGKILNVTISPLAGSATDASGLVLVLTDITERRRLQQQLAQSEKMSSLGQMISGVAHELNNPLASVLGYAQLLGAQNSDEQTAKKMKVLMQEAQRCQKIVRNLLSFARRWEPEQVSLSLNEVIESVLALMRYQLRVDGVDLHAELSRDLPAIRGDTHQLQQALVNLLTNAQQSILQAGDSGTIDLCSRRLEDGSVRLEVRDSGPGVPEEIRPRIFDPFFTTKSEGSGTGLGLSLVYGIVTSHGGLIEYQPGEDGGACFLITLPAGKAAPQAMTRGELPEEAAPSLSGRILVVDDEPALAGMICEALSGDGHRAVQVSDGREALQLINDGNEQFDLIISDIKMPGMGAEALLRELRKASPELTARFLLTTGDTVGGATQAFVERNGLPLLRKPFDLEHLRRTVRARLAAAREE